VWSFSAWPLQSTHGSLGPGGGLGVIAEPARFRSGFGLDRMSSPRWRAFFSPFGGSPPQLASYLMAKSNYHSSEIPISTTPHFDFDGFICSLRNFVTSYVTVTSLKGCRRLIAPLVSRRGITHGAPATLDRAEHIVFPWKHICGSFMVEARYVTMGYWRLAVFLRRIMERRDDMTRSHVLLHCNGDCLASVGQLAWEGRRPSSIRVLLAGRPAS